MNSQLPAKGKALRVLRCLLLILDTSQCTSVRTELYYRPYRGGGRSQRIPGMIIRLCITVTMLNASCCVMINFLRRNPPVSTGDLSAQEQPKANFQENSDDRFWQARFTRRPSPSSSPNANKCQRLPKPSLVNVDFDTYIYMHI